MNKISQSAAARRLLISRQQLRQEIMTIEKKTGKLPDWLIDDGNVRHVDVDSAAWKEFEKQEIEKHESGKLHPPSKPNGGKGKSMSFKSAVKKIEKIKKDMTIEETEPAGKTPKTAKAKSKKQEVQNIIAEKSGMDFEKLQELSLKAEVAIREQNISKAKISKEKAIQEELKTLEMKKELAPIDLIKFAFSFCEGLIKRQYARPHEIAPELETLFISGKRDLAVNKIIRELEAIVIEAQKDLIEKMKQEGYKIEKNEKMK